MLLDTIISIAFKNSLGQYDVKRISIFEINSISIYFNCSHVAWINNKEVEFKIECPICGECHYYYYNIMEFVKGSMIIGGCEKVGYPIFFIGNSEKVEEKINKYNEVNRNIYEMIH